MHVSVCSQEKILFTFSISIRLIVACIATMGDKSEVFFLGTLDRNMKNCLGLNFIFAWLCRGGGEDMMIMT